MSENDHAQEAGGSPEQASESRWPNIDRRSFLRRTALTGVAAGSVSTILSACGSSSSGTTSSSASGGSGGNSASVFGSHKSYKFVFVNHVTTNPFFTPTQYGAADAAKLLGCSVQWTGSASSNVPQMVTAFNTAISGGADGIACSMIDPKAFTGPTAAALKKGIPVLAYNADEPNGRLAYIGQDLFVSGQQMGEHIKKLVPSGSVALFIATPGSANIQPRIDGAIAAL